MKGAGIATLLVLAMNAGCSYSTPTHTPKGFPTNEGVELSSNWRSGGSIAEYAMEVNRHEISGNQVRVESGVCLSACTLFIDSRVDRFCTKRNVQYKFHGPQNLFTGMAGIPIRGMSEAKVDHHVEHLSNWYNEKVPGLGDWYKSTGAKGWGMTGFVTLTGGDLIDNFNVKEC